MLGLGLALRWRAVRARRMQRYTEMLATKAELEVRASAELACRACVLARGPLAHCPADLTGSLHQFGLPALLCVHPSPTA